LERERERKRERKRERRRERDRDYAAKQMQDPTLNLG